MWLKNTTPDSQIIFVFTRIVYMLEKGKLHRGSRE